MVRPWRSANSWLFMFFAVLWFSFFFTIMSVVSKNKIIIINKVSYHSWSEVLNKNPTIFIYSLLPILSIFFLYVALAKFLNKTTYSITDRGLSISYSPLPWPKNNRTYYRTEIVQIYIQQRISRSKNGSTTRSFRVAAEFKNASDAVIESGFSNYSDARILEQWIESKFNLQDVSVADEVGT